jgi:hypothetical protein
MGTFSTLARSLKVGRDFYEVTDTLALECYFPQRFKPNPGAQEQVFEHISLDPAIANPTPHSVIYYRGGINSGKSFAGGAFACSNALRDPQARGLITSNSYGQLESSTLVALAEFCKKFNVPLSPVAQCDRTSPDWADLTAKRIANNRFCTIFGAPVLVMSAESFTSKTASSKEPGRGLQVRWFWGDEFAYADYSAFQTIRGRMDRGPGSMKAVGLITSSINRNDPYNWLYDLFDDPDRDESRTKFYLSIRGSSTENIHAAADFVEQQASALTKQLVLIEIDAEYTLASSNIAYHEFDRTLNDCKDEALLPDILHIGADFNIGKMAAVVHVIRDGLPRAVDEFYGLKDTPALIVAIAARYPDQLAKRNINLYPDASGQYGRATVDAGLSDVTLLRRAGFKIVVNPANPPVRDRLNAMNAMFHNAAFERRYLVNVKKCPKYVNCLNKQINGEDGLPFKPKVDDISHILDAAGYFIVKKYPISRQGISKGPRLY